MVVEAVQRRLLSDEAHHRLRTAIVDGTIAPGTSLRDGDLAEQLGLSRAPVREAIKRLVSEGLVVSKPQSYTRVAPLDGRLVRDACVVVRTMHELAARLGVPRLETADVEAMVSANETFARAVRDDDVDGALAADDDLHDVLVRAANNHALTATVERYTPLVRRLERMQFASVTGERSVALHEELIQHCRNGAVDDAVAVTAQIFSALEEHLRTSS